MSFKPELLDEFLMGYSKPDDLVGKDGIFQNLKKALL